tara:strand:+ start:53 stop:475 length:423 start_codon:yes stop_codon:yes gene_type:complete
MDVLKYHKTYLKLATEISKLSYCKRKKVGALIVKNNMIISDGFNGTPTGFDNTCEIDNVTKWYVLHAEANAILKCAKHGRSCLGATMYLTLSPCKDCAKLIYQAGIVKIYFSDYHYNTEGLDFLDQAKVQYEHLNVNNTK